MRLTRYRTVLSLLLALVAGATSLFITLRFTDWQRITCVAVSALVFAAPLLLRSEIELRRKRARSERFMREIMGEADDGREM